MSLSASALKDIDGETHQLAAGVHDGFRHKNASKDAFLSALPILLSRYIQRKLAVANPYRQAFGETCGRFLAIGADEFRKCGEEACLRQTIAVDSVKAGFGPGLAQIAKCCAFGVLVKDRGLCVLCSHARFSFRLNDGAPRATPLID